MDLFRAAHRWGEGEKAPSINSVTHPTMMKLGTVIPHLAKNIQKRYKSCDTHLDISIFSLEISNLCYIKKHRCRLHLNNIILTFFSLVLKIVSKYGCNFDDVSKIGYSRPS